MALLNFIIARKFFPIESFFFRLKIVQSYLVDKANEAAIQSLTRYFLLLQQLNLV